MSELVTCTLEDICVKAKGAIISGPFGSNISKKYFVENGIPVIRGNNLTTNHIKFIDDGFVFITEEKANELNCDAYCGDLIFTAAGTIGQVGIIPKNSKYNRYVISNKQIRARIDTNIVDLDYAYCWFASPWIQTILENNNKGSTVPLLTLAEVKALPITYPRDLGQQKALAKVLVQLDSKMENNDLICSNLDGIAKLVYDYWFIQFDFPDENGKPYKSSGGKMVWNEELKREIPEGWKVIVLKDHFHIDRGISYSSENISTGVGTPMINLACIDKNRNYRAGELKYFSGEIPEKNYLNAGDLLIACTDLTRKAEIIGCPILVPEDGKKYIYSMDIAKISFSEEELNDLYMYMTLRTNFYHNYIKKWASGTNVLHLNLEGLEWYAVCVPPMNLQNRYAKIIKVIHSKKSDGLSENQLLAELRDFLLPMLMNGQVKIKESTGDDFM